MSRAFVRQIDKLRDDLATALWCSEAAISTIEGATKAIENVLKKHLDVIGTSVDITGHVLEADQAESRQKADYGAMSALVQQLVLKTTIEAEKHPPKKGSRKKGQPNFNETRHYSLVLLRKEPVEPAPAAAPVEAPVEAPVKDELAARRAKKAKK